MKTCKTFGISKGLALPVAPKFSKYKLARFAQLQV